ncbi:MAG TPA: hypothetical protein VGQ36_03500 [Thermoanaerobaculia bacterium]|jgi:hypothetical protein|nr:hypothetical protein [Thermoanaerobaculia bacterium]
MRWLIHLFAVIYSAVALIFATAAVVLVGLAVRTLWNALRDSQHQASEVIESIGILAVALVALEIAQTVVEEEVVRRAQISAPTRVRRYLSRFLVVVVVACRSNTSSPWSGFSMRIPACCGALPP